MFRVLFESRFTRMISTLKYKWPPQESYTQLYDVKVGVKLLKSETGNALFHEFIRTTVQRFSFFYFYTSCLFTKVTMDQFEEYIRNTFIPACIMHVLSFCISLKMPIYMCDVSNHVN